MEADLRRSERLAQRPSEPNQLISRWEGGLFLFYYIAYTTYLVLTATAHDALNDYRNAMIAFVLPLTIITFAVILWRTPRLRRADC